MKYRNPERGGADGAAPPTAQAGGTHPLTHERLLRWQLDTDAGRKITYAATADDARRKAEARGHAVHAVRPSQAAS